ncbi:PREDICTED: interleukin-27 subunit beta [Tinamus guttatus]|uniref:interleukin-27 subunit beta n=1 Tax=Tinamus guttatus TaxID=94827 RepID=UPI00052EDDAD|nr:PREDICTED: interleukin-27 subunit beta [Tinamus guttatus]
MSPGGCNLQHGTLGAAVLLRCPAASPAAWCWGNTPLGTHPAPGLALPNASRAHEGRYSCHHPGTGDTWATVCLRLGCDRECVRTGPHSCSFGDIQLFSLTPYVLNVTAVNPLGAASRLLPFLVEDVIKPDPPEDLRVSPIPGETKKLLLEWSPPGSWPFPGYFPLKYYIRYTWDENASSQTLGPYEQTSFTLTGLHPGASHHVQVAAKDFTDAGQFSAWSQAASGTPWMEP